MLMKHHIILLLGKVANKLIVLLYSCNMQKINVLMGGVIGLSKHLSISLGLKIYNWENR